ncbi:MAG: hypothetical protein AABY74_00025, partial [Planctomycetota bacterium]
YEKGRGLINARMNMRRQAEYNPEKPEPPLDSKMSFTPADFCIGESGIWFFSLLWEHGKNGEPEEFLDDRNILAETVG